MLVLGLALCELQRVLFTEEDGLENYLEYLQDSHLTLTNWDKAVQCCKTLLSTGKDVAPVPQQEDDARYVFSAST